MKYTYVTLNSLLEMGRYIPVYHTGTPFFPHFHTGTYQYIYIYIHLFSHFSDVYTYSASNKCTGTSKFPFRALAKSMHK
jgi:hypothetical protein